MMEERKTYTTDDAIKEAERYIIKNDISDEDTKQTIYMLALNFVKNNHECNNFAEYISSNAAQNIIKKYTAPEDNVCSIDVMYNNIHRMHQIRGKYEGIFFI